LDSKEHSDKQLQGIEFELVLEKSRHDQALTAKEFAVLAGISYSTARVWFHSPGFPALKIGRRPRVFWKDFVTWRSKSVEEYILPPIRPSEEVKGMPPSLTSSSLPPRALKILHDA
jgi:hypothetical protein